MQTPTETRRAKVCVLGSYAQALVMTADRIPQEGETLIGRDFRETYGGKGSDMAVQAARLGAEVSYVGVVGDDTYGSVCSALLTVEGVDTTHLRVTSERPTGVGFIVKDVAAKNVIVVDMGANEVFGPQDVDAAGETIASADVVLAQLEIPLATAMLGLARARAAGVTTVLNPAPAVDLRDVDLSDVDVLTPNETEARITVGLPPDSDVPNAQIAAQLLARGARAVVMTLGEDGAEVFTADSSSRVPAQVVDVVDSNGAGDSFNAGLSVALGEGSSLVEAAHLAGAVAALCCRSWETVPSYGTRAEVDEFLAQVAAGGGGDGDGV